VFASEGRAECVAHELLVLDCGPDFKDTLREGVLPESLTDIRCGADFKNHLVVPAGFLKLMCGRLTTDILPSLPAKLVTLICTIEYAC
jgi:hypothetical protein